MVVTAVQTIIITIAHVLLFCFRLKQGKLYPYSGGKMDEESFIQFVEEGYKLTASQPVPPPVSKL